MYDTKYSKTKHKDTNFALRQEVVQSGKARSLASRERIRSRSTKAKLTNLSQKLPKPK